MLFSSNEGQELSICTPYPALKLSPKTTIVLAAESILFEEFTGTISVSKIAKFTKRQTLKDLILEVKNITKEVNSPEGALTIVQEVNLSIAEGELVSLVGPSGSGKTTLLAIMAGLDLPSQGSVTLLGAEITSLDEDKRAQIRGQDVGFVFQSFHLLAKNSALDNVLLPMKYAGTEIKEATKRAKFVLDQVGLSDRINHGPSELSGGQQQRVAIARALVNKPKILFADEPTGNLDKKSSSAITDLLFSVNEQMQTTLVLVTHDLVLAEKCEKIYELSEGRLL